MTNERDTAAAVEEARRAVCDLAWSLLEPFDKQIREHDEQLHGLLTDLIAAVRADERGCACFRVHTPSCPHGARFKELEQQVAESEDCGP